MCSIIRVGERLHKVLGQIDLGALDSGERSLPLGLLVLFCCISNINSLCKQCRPASDLGLHCLPVSLLWDPGTRRLNCISFEPPHDKTNKMACASSLIRVFTVRMKKAWVLCYPLSANEDSDQTGRMPRLI